MAEFINIEKYIEGAIVKTLRALFSTDPDFTYVIDNNKEAELGITAGKPRESIHSIPNIFLHNISYNISDLSLNNSYTSDIINAEGKESQEHIYNVPFRCNLTTTSERSSVSKDLANRVVDWLWIRDRECINRNFNIKITGLQKSPGNEIKLSENKDFFTDNIGVEGYAKIRTVYTPTNISGILAKVDVAGEYSEGIHVELDLS
jgi:glutaredoxin